MEHLYTIWCCELSNTGHIVGTIYITTAQAQHIEDAKLDARKECAYEWFGTSDDADRIHVLGVATGQVQLVEWEEPCMVAWDQPAEVQSPY